jgi:glycosyltransferase involved in cell wall biosynthesis
MFQLMSLKPVVPGRPLRLAFVDYIVEPDRPGTTGLSDINWNMARELARLGDEVHVVGPYAVDPEPVPGVAVHRFRLPPVGYRNIAGHLLIALAARRALARLPRPDAIHAPEYFSAGVIAPLTRTPFVLTTPGNIYERVAAGINPWDPVTTRAFMLAARSAARSCVMVAAISEHMAWWWRETGARADKVEVIPHGVDTDLFRPSPGAARELGLAPDRTHLVWVGRLSPSKNLPMLFRAVARSEDASPRPFQVHLLGAGKLEANLRAEAAALGLGDRVLFHGKRPLAEMPRWYAAADAVVLPSKSEGLPRAMLESMACGATFVGTAISGVVDHVRDGRNGYVVPSDDVEALAERLRLVREHPERAREIGARARAYVEQRLTWPIVIDQFRRALTARLVAAPEVGAARTDPGLMRP